MKFLKRIRSRLNRFLAPQPGKNGSSMAFVMIIGAVLVIWVLAIMPLTVAVGSNSLTIQSSYADYLQSRSAIEFCKGELEKMVETKPPYTFCVVKNDDGTYSPVPKMESNSLTEGYKAVIDWSATDDTADTPLDGEAGKNVVAICAISQEPDQTNVYNISITTYNNGAKGLTYTAVYTIRGSLLINPESYLKSQALPLSDFVVVDGKLGGNTIWNSNIHDDDMTFEEGKENSITNLSAIRESLLPYVSNPGDGYADSGIFPAVFKTTVLPAGSGTEDGNTESGSTAITTDSNVGYIIPYPVSNDTSSDQLTDGNIWYVVSDNSISIKMRLDGNDIDITDCCTVYYNGITGFPSGSLYQVSIDFSGYPSDTKKVLPAYGLTMPTLLEQTVSAHEAPEVSATITTTKTKTITATFDGDITGVLFGYCTSDGIIQSWTSDTSITIYDASSTYFFYAYKPASVDSNGVYRTASSVIYLGYADPIKYATSLSNNSKYLIVNENGYAMYCDQNQIKTVKIDIDTVLSNSSSYSKYIWTASNQSSGFKFKNNDNNNYLRYNRNLSMGSSNNATSFSVSFTNEAATVRASNRYLTIGNSSVSMSKAESTVYFVPLTQTTVTAPTVTAPTTQTGTYSVTHGQTFSDFTDVLVNGASYTTSTASGTYHTTANVNGITTYIGILTVNKAELNYASSLSVVPDADGKTNTISVTVNGIHSQNGGAVWVGYRASGSSDYKWFHVDSDNNPYSFVLPYGTYEFVAYETGSVNYSSVITTPVTVTLTEPASDGGEDTDGSSEQASMMMGSSLYFMGRDGAIDTEGSTIYLNTDLLVLRHGIIGGGSVIVAPYNTTDSNTYNAAEYPDADTLLFAVNDIEDASGNVIFEALTFYRISVGTNLNDISTCAYVTATYMDGNPVYTWKEGSSFNIDDDVDTLKLLLRSGDYPDINMDIAYIDRENNADKLNDDGTHNNEQLAHIVSGETIDWLDNGVMHNRNDRNYGIKYHENDLYDSMNRQFVVCAYITEVSNVSIERTANRILIAAEETDDRGVKSYTLNVPNSLTFTCRYFSIFASTINQTDPDYGSIIIEDLGQDPSFVGTLEKILGLSNYSSKSLQVDFESTTKVVYHDNSTDLQTSYSIPGQIFRLNNSVNLFGEYSKESLMVTYSSSEIQNWIAGLGFIKAKVTVVDRYTRLTAESSPNLSIGSLFSPEVSFYTNYLYIDNTIDSINLSGLFGSGSFNINSQESGYKSEYLGFFTKNSVETYNGTIIYIQPKEGKKIGDEGSGITVNSTQIVSGFYFIPATDKGTSITALTDLGTEKNNQGKPWAIDPADLSKYSIYIKGDGTLSDAYVDTGLIGNSDMGESGFSGGNVG